MAERADYYDTGFTQQIGTELKVGVDSFYKLSKDMIDEGQFGAPIILTPFNYAKGRQYGLEFTADYTLGDFNAYANYAMIHAVGEDWVTSQFDFDPAISPMWPTTSSIWIMNRSVRRRAASPIASPTPSCRSTS